MVVIRSLLYIVAQKLKWNGHSRKMREDTHNKL
jgi:hypothetical protein